MHHGAELAALVDAAHAGDEEILATHRDGVTASMGRAAMVDALAVYANFSMMTRIADGTGTPLDPMTATVSKDFRASLGLDDLTSARL